MEIEYWGVQWIPTPQGTIQVADLSYNTKQNIMQYWVFSLCSKYYAPYCTLVYIQQLSISRLSLHFPSLPYPCAAVRATS